MQPILNKDYRVTFKSAWGKQAVSFLTHVANEGDWNSVQERLTYKQRNWPERNYTLQIWNADKEAWQDYTNPKSKYALFSED